MPVRGSLLPQILHIGKDIVLYRVEGCGDVKRPGDGVCACVEDVAVVNILHLVVRRKPDLKHIPLPKRAKSALMTSVLIHLHFRSVAYAQDTSEQRASIANEKRSVRASRVPISRLGPGSNQPTRAAQRTVDAILERGV